MGTLPQGLRDALCPVTVVVGHYGSGKTNLCMNLAVDAAAEGLNVTVIDLDVVNPYFRATEQRTLLEDNDIRLIAPVFAEAGTSLDVPSLTGGIAPAIEGAGEGDLVIIDAGGDDVGATALGRFAHSIAAKPYTMLYVANAFRNLMADPADALENMREIEEASHLGVTALINNSHLKDQTDEGTVREGIAYAQALASLAELPLTCTTLPLDMVLESDVALYPVDTFVRNPWE